MCIPMYVLESLDSFVTFFVSSSVSFPFKIYFFKSLSFLINFINKIEDNTEKFEPDKF